MMRGHARFEALAGAVALGEATAAEAEDFARHAPACISCSADLGGAAPLAALERLRDEEAWRPAVDAAVLERIRDRRTRRSRFTLNALTYGVVISIVLNVLLVGGVGAPLMHILHPSIAPPADVAWQRLTIEHRASHRAPAPHRSIGHADVPAGLDIASWPCAASWNAVRACIERVSFRF
jgi:hypothetical protein